MTQSDNQRVTPGLEARVASEIVELVAGIPIGAGFSVAPSAPLCFALELFLPQLLRGQYPAWEHESLDGFFVAVSDKTGPSSVELAGTCILISDQTVTPFLMDFTVSPSGKSIESYRVCIGEPGAGSLGISGPECNSRQARELLATVPARCGSIAWCYTVASDHERSH